MNFQKTGIKKNHINTIYDLAKITADVDNGFRNGKICRYNDYESISRKLHEIHASGTKCMALINDANKGGFRKCRRDWFEQVSRIVVTNLGAVKNNCFDAYYNTIISEITKWNNLSSMEKYTVMRQFVSSTLSPLPIVEEVSYIFIGGIIILLLLLYVYFDHFQISTAKLAPRPISRSRSLSGLTLHSNVGSSTFHEFFSPEKADARQKTILRQNIEEIVRAHKSNEGKTGE